MNTLNIEGWRKAPGDQKSTPIGPMQFHVSEAEHRRMEQAEEQLRISGAADMMVEADMHGMALMVPEECGTLADCKWRVYLGGEDMRGQFHLVGYSTLDGSLVYSNAVMVDQLG